MGTEITHIVPQRVFLHAVPQQAFTESRARAELFQALAYYAADVIEILNTAGPNTLTRDLAAFALAHRELLLRHLRYPLYQAQVAQILRAMIAHADLETPPNLAREYAVEIADARAALHKLSPTNIHTAVQAFVSRVADSRIDSDV